MIGFFPMLYPDELLYSLLARYYSRSGYMAYTFAAEDLFQNRNVKPNIEFINALSDDVLQVITKNTPLQTVVEKHTMFPYYARFLDCGRRCAAFHALMTMDEQYRNLLPLPKSKDCRKRYLRYCPLCAAADREAYGETYWHRAHQLIGVNVCPLHGCKLVCSGVLISSKDTPALITAEKSVPESEMICFSEIPAERHLAEYVCAVFQADVNFECDVSIGKFLHAKLEYTKYVSPRGEKRNTELLHKEFSHFYSMLPERILPEQWQLQKVFNSKRTKTEEICAVAMFLGVSAEELTQMRLPEKFQWELFDEKVRKLHAQGMNYAEIAEKLGASYDFVKLIGGKQIMK